jgi:4,5-dihydroxyphthalate decarboxylase
MAYKTIRLASRTYDGTLPILRGQLQLPGFDLKITEMSDVAGMFAGMFTGRYDVGEMSLGELVYYTSRSNAEFIGIPVFPSRMFRHGFIFRRRSSGVNNPGDLSGKNIGFLRWVQTAAIWMRGMLVDEYGVSASATRWYIASMHHWDDADPSGIVEPRDDSIIHRIESKGKNASERACRALFDGEIDALGVTESQLPMLLANHAVDRLFADPRQVEISYFQRTKILPIMHVVAVRKKLVNEHPELPEKLFRLYADAKQWAQHWRRAIPSLVEAWPNHYISEEEKIFKTDPWAYGVEANRHVLARFLTYCYDQGVSATSLAPDELFCPSTLRLVE